ncbi:2-oxo acid dehydrogenase [Pelomyxa schiedti]|nr:2-oxo acid dehydrogenase [Pelomyxa schiedti]
MGAATVALVLCVAYLVFPKSMFLAGACAILLLLWVYASSGMTLRQKIAIATWEPQSDSRLLARARCDATEAIAFIDELRRSTNEHITITHLVGSAVAIAMAQEPCLCGRIVWGRFKPWQSVDVGFLVNVSSTNLAFHTIRDAHSKSPLDIATELNEGSNMLRKGQDKDFNFLLKLASIVPTFILRPCLQAIGFLSCGVGLEIPFLGVKKCFMGNCIVTNVGSFGIDEAFAPFPPFSYVPVLVLVGALYCSIIFFSSNQRSHQKVCHSSGGRGSGETNGHHYSDNRPPVH